MLRNITLNRRKFLRVSIAAGTSAVIGTNIKAENVIGNDVFLGDEKNENPFPFYQGSSQVYSESNYYCVQENIDKRKLRILNFSINNNRDLEFLEDYQKNSSILPKEQPNIIVFQNNIRDNKVKQKKFLFNFARLTNLHQTYISDKDNESQNDLGVLSSEYPLSYKILPVTGKRGNGVIQIIEFNNYSYCNIPISLASNNRMKALALIEKEISNINKPLFISGIYNKIQDKIFIEELQRNFKFLSEQKIENSNKNDSSKDYEYLALSSKDATSYVCLSVNKLKKGLPSGYYPKTIELIRKHPSNNIIYMSPYLMNPTNNGITVLWQTTVPCYSWVEYGTGLKHLKKERTLIDGQVACNTTLNKIRLKNLIPGKKYYYRICSQEILYFSGYRKVFGETEISDLHSFTIPEEHVSVFKALIFNDLHNADKVLEKLYQQVKDVDYDFIVFNGDCIAGPESREQASKLIKRYHEIVNTSDKPVFYIRGNHEARNAYSLHLKEIVDYVEDKTYGAFNWGDTRFVVLDCGESKSDTDPAISGLNDFDNLREEQIEFLKEESLSKSFNKASKRVLIEHIPTFGWKSPFNPSLDVWGNLLNDIPFNVSINAHTHKFTYYPKAAIGNPYPVVIGGGPSIESATVMILTKKEESLKLQVLNTKGKQLLNLDL